MNQYKILEQRQKITRFLLEQEQYRLYKREFNPITGMMTDPPPETPENQHSAESPVDYVISPDAGLNDALTKALELISGVPEYKIDIDSVIRYVKPAAEQLRLDKKPIKEIKRRHVLFILEQCGRNKKIWTDATYNRYRHHLSVLFHQLVKVEAMEHNPVDKYLEPRRSTQDETEEMREVLTAEEIKLINDKLPEMNYPFWRYLQVFCNSGARGPEMMKLRVGDIDLGRQMARYVILKSKKKRIVERAIKDDVLYLWHELMNEASKLGPKAYVFSAGLVPGPAQIRKDQIKRRWRVWIQGRLGIKKTPYSLKYLNTDLLDSLYGSSIPAALNKHSEEMVIKHYAVSRKKRTNEILKKSPNPLAIAS